MHERRSPATFVQEQYFHATAAEDASANLSIALMLEGSLDRVALQRALMALVARHETLRTALVLDQGGLEQVVLPARHVPVGEHDASQADTPQDALLTAMAADCARPLPLRDAQSLRASLVRLAPQRHAVMLTVHHGMADGWSLRVLIRDLSRLYRTGGSEARAGLRPLPLQLGDYAVRERGVQDADRATFWRATLGGVAPPDPLLPGAPTSRGRERELADPAMLSALRTIARRHGVSLATALLAVVAAVCARPGRDDLVVGFVHANRDQPQVAGLVGHLADVIPVRIQLAGDPTLGELLERADAAKKAAYAARVPFGVIHRLVGNDGLWCQRRVYDVSFNYLPRREAGPASWREVALPGNMTRWRLAHDPLAPFNFECRISAAPSGLRGGFTVDGRWMDAVALDEHVQALSQAIALVVAHPDAHLSALSDGLPVQESMR